MSKRQNLEKSTFSSKNHTAYHGSKVKVQLNLDRNIKKNFFYFLNLDGSWKEVSKEKLDKYLE